MAVEIPKITYSGKVKQLTLGKGSKAVTIGGETAYPFYLFEGAMPNLPKIAMEVWDCPPEDWAPAALEPFAGVTGDPVAWAKKCINDYGAQMICLQLISTDSNGLNRDAAAAAAVVKKVADAIDVPLIVWGTANHEKDTEVLRQVAELCQDKSLILGPVEEGDHKRIGAAALAYHHTVIASSPIDINL
ncbi:MAG TPA: acetyl-CoA decarbonylase/synthase complex subunit delta, partial [Dehalococcoidales bacterium]|nr:acetyl-CoA decarbonylase/synthase complex subunit delta [Dehalococcoidales bacterium]